MPRKRTEINVKNLQLLKQLVVEHGEVQLQRSRDCDILARIVSVATQEYINGITFKRLYGFTKYTFNPSIQTLDILTQFIGYNNWYHFESSLLEKQPISKTELDILLSFYDFDLINNIQFHDGGIQSISRKIALRFREDIVSVKQAIPRLARMKYAQTFFTEHFPDYDNLCTYYYLLYEEYLKVNKTPSACIFGNAMLFLKSFWVLDKAGCRRTIQRLNSVQISAEFHPFLIGHYYACNILYDAFYGQQEKVDASIAAYLELQQELPKKGFHFKDFPASEYILAEALLHVGRYNECIAIIESCIEHFTVKIAFSKKGYYRQLQLLWLIAQKKLNPSFQFAPILKRINPKYFYFISAQYFTVLLLYLSGSPADLEQAKSLAKEMNNQYLLHVFLPNE